MLRTGLVSLLALLVIVPVFANDGTVKLENKLKEYFHRTAEQVHETENSAAKREILNNSFDKITTALETVENVTNISESDVQTIGSLKERIMTKSNELNGQNGFERIPDAQLNSFADYVQQDFEQADRVVTLSLTTVLLIVIILLLL